MKKIWWTISICTIALTTVIGIFYQLAIPTSSSTFVQRLQHNQTRKSVPLSKTDKKRVQRYLKTYIQRVPNQSNLQFLNSNIPNKMTTSEATGYGMMILVLAQIQGIQTEKTFNQFTKYVEANQDGQTGLMSWKQTYTKAGIKKFKNSATDGDLWIAESLLVGSSVYHHSAYRNQANSILLAILEQDYNPQTQALAVGNWATSSTQSETIRTSDVIPAFFKDFYQASKDTRWKKINISMTKALFKSQETNVTGLVPDFVQWNGQTVSPVYPNFLGDTLANDFGYSAFRIPLNLSLDDDSKLRPVRAKLLRFFSGQSQFLAGYDLTGSPINSWTSKAISGSLYPLAKQNPLYASSNLESQSHTSIKQARITGTHYYEETLGVLGLLLGSFYNN